MIELTMMPSQIWSHFLAVAAWFVPREWTQKADWRNSMKKIVDCSWDMESDANLSSKRRCKWPKLL